MVEIQDMQEAYKTAVDKVNSYISESHEFAENLIDALTRQLNIEKYERLEFYPVDGSRDMNKKYDIRSSMNLKNDSYWHFGFDLHIS